MNEKEKTTVPIPPVGADGEQSLSYVSNEIITAETEEINPMLPSISLIFDETCGCSFGSSTIHGSR